MTMNDFEKLLAVTSKDAIRFFFAQLKDEAAARKATLQETLYVASMLAHFAQTSRSSATDVSPSGSLYDVLDTFVLPGLTAEGFHGLRDPEILELGGSHTLLLVGFFRDQVKSTHNLGWYDHLGRSFFGRAGEYSREKQKAAMLRQVAQHFPLWVTACQSMSRNLRDERYLLPRNSQ